MPSNAAILLTYDLSVLPISSADLLGASEPASHEWAAQCVAFETLRTLIVSLITVEEYNNLTDEEWQAVVDQSAERANLIPGPPVNQLSENEKMGAGNLGGNYFEHTYDVIMANQQDPVSFTRLGGVQ